MSASYDINTIYNLPLKAIVKAILHAYEKQDEQKAWAMWIAIYPNMNKENFMPFSEFYEMAKQSVDSRSTHELLAEFEQISELMRGE